MAANYVTAFVRLNLTVNMIPYKAITSGENVPITLPMNQLNVVGAPFFGIETILIPTFGIHGIVRPRQSINTYPITYHGRTHQFHLIFKDDHEVHIGVPAIIALNIKRLNYLKRIEPDDFEAFLRRHRRKHRSCKGIKNDGQLCTRKARPGHRGCFQHQYV